MPRNSSGTYTLPIGAFSPNQTIKSADTNSNLSDIATALTQSLATTGVSTMTGPVLGSSGSAAAPGYTFGSSKTDGIYLAGTHQVGIATSGVQAVTFNSDQSVTFAAGASWAGAVTFSSTSTFTGAVTLNATTYTFGAGAANAFMSGLATEVDVQAFIDGGGSAITNSTPNNIIWLTIPCALTINTWSLAADQSGSITIDILRTNAAFPSTSIVGAGTKPSLSAAQTSLNNAPSSWTATTLAKDDLVGFVTSGAATVQKLNITLRCTRTAA
jgi:hypothetical protein